MTEGWVFAGQGDAAWMTDRETASDIKPVCQYWVRNCVVVSSRPAMMGWRWLKLNTGYKTCDNTYMVRSRISPVVLALAIVSIFCILSAVNAYAKGMWSKVASSGQGDAWYIDQTLGYENKHGKVMTSRGYVKCIPGEDSSLGEEIRESLDLSGIVSANFAYFVGAIAIDCGSRLFHFSEITFYDAEDSVIYRVNYDERQNYSSASDHPSENISHYLCIDKSSFFDTLKKQEPFLYFFPK